MSDRVAVMHDGRILQCDEPGQIFRRPASRFVASFFKGCNVLQGRVTGQDSNQLLISVAGAPVRMSCEGCTLPSGSEVTVGLRAENLRLGRRTEGCDVRFDAVVEAVMYRGTTTDHILELNDKQRLTATTTQMEEGVSGGRSVLVGAMADDFLLLRDD